MPVLAGIVPAHSMICNGAPIAAGRECELIRRNRMPDGCPNLTASMPARKWLGSHVEDPPICAERILPFIVYVIVTF